MSVVKTHSVRRQGPYRSSPLKETMAPDVISGTPRESEDHGSPSSSLRRTGSWSTAEDSASDENQDDNKVGEKRPTDLLRQNKCPVCSGELATTVFDTSNRLRASELEAYLPRKGGEFCLAKHDEGDVTNVLQAGPKLILPQRVPYECILVSCETCCRSKFGCLAQKLLKEEEQTSRCGLTDTGKTATSHACKKSRNFGLQLANMVGDLGKRRPEAFARLEARRLNEDSHIGIFLESTREPLLSSCNENKKTPKLHTQLLRKLQEKLRPKVDDEKVLKEDNVMRQREHTARSVSEAQNGTSFEFRSPYTSESRKAPTRLDFSHMTPLQRWKYHLLLDEPWEWDEIERSAVDFRNSLKSSWWGESWKPPKIRDMPLEQREASKKHSKKSYSPEHMLYFTGVTENMVEPMQG